jgi:hypothetical protein
VTEKAVQVAVPRGPAEPAAVRYRVLILATALAFVAGCRILLYAWAPDRASDFDQLYQAAARMLRGDNPYLLAMQRFPYPLPAVLLAVPFTTIPLELARPIFDILVGWAFVYALWRYRGSYALLAVLSGAYLFAMARGQTTPLMVAAVLIPALGFLLAIRPNTSAALWVARPSRMALLGVLLFVLVSVLLRPSWGWDWWLALPIDNTPLMPPVLRPFGFVLLIAALRWRSPEGRLLLALAFLPQTTLPYELVALALIPANALEMLLYVVGSWAAVMLAGGLYGGADMAEWNATGWPVTLCAAYVPMLYLVVRRNAGWSGHKIKRVGKLEKDRRRPHRLPDEELVVEVSRGAVADVVVKVTHRPTKLSSTESGPNRRAAERKAQDKLAALVAEARRSESAA